MEVLDERDRRIFNFSHGQGRKPQQRGCPGIANHQASGLPYELNPMGTCVEGEWKEVMDLVDQCFYELQKDSSRVYLALKADYRKGPSGRLKSKVESVKKKLK